LTQKRDLRKKWCCCTHLVAAKASNTKGFVDFSRSVALSDPITRGLKAFFPFRISSLLSDPITRGLKTCFGFQFLFNVALSDPITRGLKDQDYHIIELPPGRCTV
jgi:hypothetical protein